jgi:hypothetical protein
VNGIDGMDLINRYNVTAPGVVMLPVCDEDEAYQNWFSYTNGEDKSDNYQLPLQLRRLRGIVVEELMSYLSMKKEMVSCELLLPTLRKFINCAI